MSGLFGGNEPAAPPPIPTVSTAGVMAASDAARRKERVSSGRASTMLTEPSVRSSGRASTVMSGSGGSTLDLNIGTTKLLGR